MKTTTTIYASLLFGALSACGTLETRGSGAPSVEHARAVLVPVGDYGVRGTIDFTRVSDGIRVTGRITGLRPGEHGFHVHEYGDLSDQESGKSAGGHFAPRGMPHGRPTDDKRHVGDLGNVVADESGVATIDLTDRTIELSGPHSILGRSVVVHRGPDQFTQPSGNAGPRVAFGVIGLANPDAGS